MDVERKDKGVMMTAGQAAILEREERAVVPACSRDFERLENTIADEVMARAADPRAMPVRLGYRGRTILALPLDTRRFVRAMARHLSMN
jgi:hypothetical protein